MILLIFILLSQLFKTNGVPVITRKQIMEIPIYTLNNITENIYHDIIITASQGKLSYEFSIDTLLLQQKTPELRGSQNRNYIITELKEIFPDIRITSTRVHKFGNVWRASWKKGAFCEHLFEETEYEL